MWERAEKKKKQKKKKNEKEQKEKQKENEEEEEEEREGGRFSHSGQTLATSAQQSPREWQSWSQKQLGG